MRQINPTGKISLFPKGKSPLQIHAILSRSKGRWPSSPNVGMGLRWTRRHRARDGIAGRDKLRERSLGRAGRAVLKRTAKSCGPDASVVGVKSAEGKSARPGADEPAIRRRRRQQSPILRGERVISRKAIAQGMSDVLRCPVCSCALFSHNLHTRPRVQRASGIPCSLCFEGQRSSNLGQFVPRECETLFRRHGRATP